MKRLLLLFLLASPAPLISMEQARDGAQETVVTKKKKKKKKKKAIAPIDAARAYLETEKQRAGLAAQLILSALGRKDDAGAKIVFAQNGAQVTLYVDEEKTAGAADLSHFLWSEYEKYPGVSEHSLIKFRYALVKILDQLVGKMKFEDSLKLYALAQAAMAHDIPEGVSNYDRFLQVRLQAELAEVLASIYYQIDSEDKATKDQFSQAVNLYKKAMNFFETLPRKIKNQKQIIGQRINEKISLLNARAHNFVALTQQVVGSVRTIAEVENALRIAGAHFMQKNHREAIEALENVIAKKSVIESANQLFKFYYAVCLKIQCLFMLDRFNDVIVCFEKHQRAIDQYKAQLGNEGSIYHAAVLAYGRSLLRLENYDQGLECMDRLMHESIEPFISEARLEKSDLLSSRGDKEAALALLEEVIAAKAFDHEDMARAVVRKGIIFNLQGNHQEACEILAPYRKLFQKLQKFHLGLQINVLYSLAGSYAALDDTASAMACYGRILKYEIDGYFELLEKARYALSALQFEQGNRENALKQLALFESVSQNRTALPTMWARATYELSGDGDIQLQAKRVKVLVSMLDHLPEKCRGDVCLRQVDYQLKVTLDQKEVSRKAYERMVGVLEKGMAYPLSSKNSLYGLMISARLFARLGNFDRAYHHLETVFKKVQQLEDPGHLMKLSEVFAEVASQDNGCSFNGLAEEVLRAIQPKNQKMFQSLGLLIASRYAACNYGSRALKVLALIEEACSDQAVLEKVAFMRGTLYEGYANAPAAVDEYKKIIDSDCCSLPAIGLLASLVRFTEHHQYVVNKVLTIADHWETLSDQVKQSALELMEECSDKVDPKLLNGFAGLLQKMLDSEQLTKDHKKCCLLILARIYYTLESYESLETLFDQSKSIGLSKAQKAILAEFKKPYENYCAVSQASWHEYCECAPTLAEQEAKAKAAVDAFRYYVVSGRAKDEVVTGTQDNLWGKWVCSQKALHEMKHPQQKKNTKTSSANRVRFSSNKNYLLELVDALFLDFPEKEGKVTFKKDDCEEVMSREQLKSHLASLSQDDLKYLCDLYQINAEFN